MKRISGRNRNGESPCGINSRLRQHAAMPGLEPGKDDHAPLPRPRPGTSVIKIRPATIADLEFVTECARAAYARYVKRIGKEPAPMRADFQAQIRNGIVDIAEAGSRPAGYLACYAVAGDLLLESVAVHPRFAGRGIGRALIEHAESTARARGLAADRLYTNAAMTENLSLYPHLGYEETGRVIEDGFRRIYFRKTLELRR